GGGAAADLLARRRWPRADLARRLIRRGAPREVADAVIADLMARGYLDDAAFARQWVESRSARGYGAARLRAELRARGVDAASIDAAPGGAGPPPPAGPAPPPPARAGPGVRRRGAEGRGPAADRAPRRR